MIYGSLMLLLYFPKGLTWLRALLCEAWDRQSIEEGELTFSLSAYFSKTLYFVLIKGAGQH